MVLLFPELGVIQGNEPLPIPVENMIAGQHKRAIQVISLLVAMGIAIGAGTGIAGITTSMTQYNKFTSQLKSYLQKCLKMCSVSRNRFFGSRGASESTGARYSEAKEGGLCLFLHCSLPQP